MDFTPEQIKTLKSVVGEVVDDRLKINNDILRQEIRASEHRLEQKIKAAKEEVIEGVGQMIEGQIVPQLDTLDARVTKLETKLA